MRSAKSHEHVVSAQVEHSSTSHPHAIQCSPTTPLRDSTPTKELFKLDQPFYNAALVLQVEDSTPPQLVRLASEYSELGLPARAYTLSSLRFGCVVGCYGVCEGGQVAVGGVTFWVLGPCKFVQPSAQVELLQKAVLSVEWGRNGIEGAFYHGSSSPDRRCAKWLMLFAKRLLSLFAFTGW